MKLTDCQSPPYAEVSSYEKKISFIVRSRFYFHYICLPSNIYCRRLRDIVSWFNKLWSRSILIFNLLRIVYTIFVRSGRHYIVRSEELRLIVFLATVS